MYVVCTHSAYKWAKKNKLIISSPFGQARDAEKSQVSNGVTLAQFTFFLLLTSFPFAHRE